MDNDPPATPPVPVSPFGSPQPRVDAAQPPSGGWAVGAGRGWHWWTEGWRLFIAAPVMWIVIAITFFVLMLVLALVPFIGQLASTIIYPVLGAGLMIGTRELDRGGKLTIGHLFSCFNDKAVPLIIVALLYFGGWFVVWILAGVIVIGIVGFGTVATIMSGDPFETLSTLFWGMGGVALIVMLFVAIVTVPLIMAYWFAPALVVFRGDQPLAAMKASFVACLRNIPPFTVYMLAGIALAILASIPFGLGWIVLAPVYVASLWPSYKDIFGDSQAALPSNVRVPS